MELLRHSPWAEPLKTKLDLWHEIKVRGGGGARAARVGLRMKALRTLRTLRFRDMVYWCGRCLPLRDDS